MFVVGEGASSHTLSVLNLRLLLPSLDHVRHGSSLLEVVIPAAAVEDALDDAAALHIHRTGHHLVAAVVLGAGGAGVVLGRDHAERVHAAAHATLAHAT